METFQQTFVSTIVNLTVEAYNSGILQYHPMTIADITITMTMYTHFNQITVQFNNRLLSVSIFDTDNDATVYSSIQNVIADII